MKFTCIQTNTVIIKILDRVATHILAFEGNSEVVWFDGNFEQYEEDKKRRLGDQADKPSRIIYKKLTR